MAMTEKTFALGSGSQDGDTCKSSEIDVSGRRPRSSPDRLVSASPSTDSPRTATPATVRRVNRAILFNIIRSHGPISRAQLSAATGIHRSNVSFIVQELIDEGFLREERSTPAGRGRVPLLLSLNPDGFQVVGVSIRVEETVLCLADLTGQILTSSSFLTPKSPARWLERLYESLDALRSHSKGSVASIRQICVSVPGMVSQATGKILWMNALPRYSGFELRGQVEHAVGVPTIVANDCHLGATYERWRVEGSSGLRNFVFLEVGDVGVGAGIVINGELCIGFDMTFAGEFGHMTVDPAGPKCNCGRSGCWELFICDRATWQRYDPSQEFTRSRFDELVRSAQRGDKLAVRAFRITASHLAVGISNIIMILNPEAVVLAGRLAEVWDIVRRPIEEAVERCPGRQHVRPACMKAEDLFLRGAISRALSGLFAKRLLG